MIALPCLWQRAITHYGGPCVPPRGHLKMSRMVVRSCLLQSVCQFICLRRSFGNLPYTNRLHLAHICGRSVRLLVYHTLAALSTPHVCRYCSQSGWRGNATQFLCVRIHCAVYNPHFHVPRENYGVPFSRIEPNYQKRGLWNLPSSHSCQCLPVSLEGPGSRGRRHL